MKRTIGLLVAAIVLAGCSNAKDSLRNVETWRDPDRPVVCYVVDGGGLSAIVAISCVVVPE